MRTLVLDDGAETALLHAGAALDALGAVDMVHFLDLAGDGIDRAHARTGRTAAALVGDLVVEQLLAVMRGAAFFLDMCLILITEILEGGQDRVGRGLAQAAQRGSP